MPLLSLKIVTAMLFAASVSFAQAVEYPPGFIDPSPPSSQPIWDPSAGECTVVYAPTLSSALPYFIPGSRRANPNEMNYYFFFPNPNKDMEMVLSFIDPRPFHGFPKYTLDDSYGTSISFHYVGGFPPGFAVLGPVNVLGGKITVPNPKDRWARVLEVDWPFIKRDPKQINFRQYCSFNKTCVCLRN